MNFGLSVGITPAWILTMYTESIKPDADDTEELKACEIQINSWKQKAKAIQRKIITESGHPRGSRATLIRANGKRIDVVVAGASYENGKIEYVFQWPYKNYAGFRAANVCPHDKIIW